LLALPAGFTTGLSLIVAIGAQNAFVLRQGLRRQHVLVVVLLCAFSDALLIVMGILGLGAAINSAPLLIEIFRYGGAAYLLWFAFSAIRRAWRPSVLNASEKITDSLKTTVLTALALTYLNPHVYIDTVLLLGSIANQFENQWLFGLGAIAASFIWFFSLGFGASWLGNYLKKPIFWRILDLFIAFVMITIAAMLLTFQFN
jgi:L-lysine exporter family protein LysE/ArgO